jgi:hypothetical protein
MYNTTRSTRQTNNAYHLFAVMADQTLRTVQVSLTANIIKIFLYISTGVPDYLIISTKDN